MRKVLMMLVLIAVPMLAGCSDPYKDADICAMDVQNTFPNDVDPQYPTYPNPIGKSMTRMEYCMEAKGYSPAFFWNQSCRDDASGKYFTGLCWKKD